MKSITTVVIGLAFVSLLPACIEFEKQTILVKLDAEKDVLTARLIYQGIYAGGEKLEEDLKELDGVAAKGTRFFLLDNWPFEVDIARPEKGETDSPVNAILRPHTTVENGLFFLDDEGKLSAWQDVEIRNVSKILKQLNGIMNLAILTGKDGVLEDADAKTKEYCRTLALGGHEWVRLDGDGLHFVFHASEEGATKLKREFLEMLIGKALEDAGEDAATEAKDDGSLDGIEPLVRVLSRNDLSWNHRGREIRVTLAPDERGVIRAQWWNEGRYVPNLLRPAKEGSTPPKLPAKIDENVKLEMLLGL